MFSIENRRTYLLSFVCSLYLFGFVILFLNSMSLITESYGISLNDIVSLSDHETSVDATNLANLSILDNHLAQEPYNGFRNSSTFESGGIVSKFQPDKMYTLVAENINLEIAPNPKLVTITWTI